MGQGRDRGEECDSVHRRARVNILFRLTPPPALLSLPQLDVPHCTSRLQGHRDVCSPSIKSTPYTQPCPRVTTVWWSLMHADASMHADTPARYVHGRHPPPPTPCPNRLKAKDPWDEVPDNFVMAQFMTIRYECQSAHQSTNPE